MNIYSKQKLALLGGEPIRPKEKHWTTWPIFGDAEKQALLEVLESGKWWYGDRVKKFEKEFAQFQGASFCVTTSSGTTALEVCLQAIELEPGDEVIVPAYTFIATASAVVRMGGIPIFVDVNETWNIDINSIKQSITPKTRAIIPVHFGGLVCDMDQLNVIKQENGITIIEDACHSWGAQWQGKGTGTLGLGGIFSFQMSKNITAGEGGAITTNDECFAEIVRSISNCGRASNNLWYGHVRIGTNVRLTEFQAALLSAQLTRLEEHTRLRERNGLYLDEKLKEIDGLIPQPQDPRVTRRAYHLYCLRVIPSLFGCSREKLIQAAQAEGLPLSSGYHIPLYKQPAFANGKYRKYYTECCCKFAENLCYESGMWLPHYLLLGNKEDMDDIVRIFSKIKEHSHELI